MTVGEAFDPWRVVVACDAEGCDARVSFRFNEAKDYASARRRAHVLHFWLTGVLESGGAIRDYCHECNVKMYQAARAKKMLPRMR